MTSPIEGVAATAYAPQTQQTSGTANSAANSSQSLLNPQAFLQLLVAQLQYQDPTNPTDTSQFMNQTAMLSQVQTMNSMSSTLTALADAQQAQAATNLIGKQVTYVDANGARTSGVVSSANLQGGATLQIGTATVPLANVVAVAAAS